MNPYDAGPDGPMGHALRGERPAKDSGAHRMTADSDLIEARAALDMQPCMCLDGFECSRCKGLAAFGRAGVEVPDETGRNNTDGLQTQSSAGANASHPSTDTERLERARHMLQAVENRSDVTHFVWDHVSEALIEICAVLAQREQPTEGCCAMCGEAVVVTKQFLCETCPTNRWYLTQPDPRTGSDARERLAREIADHARAGYGKDLGVYAKRMSEAVRVDEGAQNVRDNPHEYDEEGLCCIRCGSMTYCEISPIRTVSRAAAQQEQGEKVTAKDAPGRFSRIISKPFWSDQWGWWLVRVRWEDGSESVADLSACVPARTVSAAEIAEYQRAVRLAAEVPTIHTKEQADG